MKVANHLGISADCVSFKATPKDKKTVIQLMQKAGEKVMFIGDGVNDSPAMAQANVGVAINSAADITVQAASIVFMRNNLEDVLRAINISTQTLRQIKINFLWAFIYNIVLVPIAMGALYLWPLICKMICGIEMHMKENHFDGFRLDPMWAGFAMALSSVSVVLSSLSLKFWNY